MYNELLPSTSAGDDDYGTYRRFSYFTQWAKQRSNEQDDRYHNEGYPDNAHYWHLRYLDLAYACDLVSAAHFQKHRNRLALAVTTAVTKEARPVVSTAPAPKVTKVTKEARPVVTTVRGPKVTKEVQPDFRELTFASSKIPRSAAGRSTEPAAVTEEVLPLVSELSKKRRRVVVKEEDDFSMDLSGGGGVKEEVDLSFFYAPSTSAVKDEVEEEEEEVKEEPEEPEEVEEVERPRKRPRLWFL